MSDIWEDPHNYEDGPLPPGNPSRVKYHFPEAMGPDPDIVDELNKTVGHIESMDMDENGVTLTGTLTEYGRKLIASEHASDYYNIETLPLGGALIVDEDVKEIRTTSETGGQKGVKLERYDLIPVRPLENLARRYGHGAEKYAERNWERGYEFSKSYAALQRHLNAFWRGEDEDEEMPGGHLGAAAFHIFSLMHFSDPRNPEYKRFDDRPHETEQ